MNAEVKSKWVAALRSGDYLQGRAFLATIVTNEQTGKEVIKWCCLGVLCDIAVKEGIIPKPKLEVNDDSRAHLVFGELGPTESKQYPNGVYPSHPVLDWAGLETQAARIKGFQAKELEILPEKYGISFKGEIGLDALNDNGVPFDTIAEAIERYH